MPDHIFVVATVVQRIHLAGLVPVKEDTALDPGAKEEFAELRQQFGLCSPPAL